MAKPSEEISKYNSSSSGKTDANLANDTLHLGGIPADEWATKRFVQQYHDNKEAILKEYIDTQDLAKLQEAKNYVDTAIRNQDFSAFAKLTDLQALSATLTAKIEECAINCANNLNTRIQAVVADTNANFADVNSAIQQLNANDEQLFQSVSSGKRKVAAAITDKGVNTASNATFDTMASNIRKIETGGGGDYDENFVNTGDATATANDIFLGKTAYVKGQKVYGTYDDFYPTYGTDTSSGNVTASDIPWGKIAFAGGQAITGTGYVNPAVEEVYAANPIFYLLLTNTTCMGKDPDSENRVIHRYCTEFSKDGNYCVSGVFLDENSTGDNKKFYIESHPVTENGIIIHGSSGVTDNSVIYKKYRYTKEELGLDDDETLSEIKLGAAGLCGNSDMCLLMIRTNTKLHFYTYHLSENGVIGKSYTSERYIVENFEHDYKTGDKGNSSWSNSIFANTNPNKLFVVSSTYRCLRFQEIELVVTPSDSNNVTINIYKTAPHDYSTSGSNDIVKGTKLRISPNDKYITSWEDKTANYSETAITVELDQNLSFNSFKYKNSQASVALETLGTKMFLESGNTNIEILNNDGTVNKTINLGLENKRKVVDIIVTPNEDKIILLSKGTDNWGYYVNNSLQINILNVEDVLNCENNGSVQPIKTFSLSEDRSDHSLSINSSGTKIIVFVNSQLSYINNVPSIKDAEMWTVTSDIDDQSLVGIIYNGQFFRNLNSGVLSATASDVVNGKTFIGSSGSVETGTAGNSV